MMFQYCIICHEKVERKPEELPTYHRYCKEHVIEGKERIANTIKQQRYIPLEFYFVYTKIKNTLYYCCLNCGKVLKRKDGDPWIKTKYCEKCKEIFEFPDFWNEISHEYYSNHKKKHDGKVYCENCNMILSEKYKRPSIHHKIPIFSLNLDNINLIWDLNNLELLCDKCHGLKHEEINRNIRYYGKIGKKHKNLEDFIKIKSKKR